MVPLDRLELPHEPVILGVRAGRCVEDEVLVVRALDLLAQRRRAGGELGP
jgi:hypothetical protein